MNPYPQDESAEEPCKNVAAFVNKNSGERAAAVFVREQLEVCLGKENVFDLFPKPGEPPAIEDAKAFLIEKRPDMVIVAGGDGTVSLGMDIADSLRMAGKIGKYECPVAVLPMGTGNDLSRSLGFGSGYVKPMRNAEKKFAKLIEKIKHARQKMVDRFQCDIYLADAADSSSDDEDDQNASAVHNASQQSLLSASLRARAQGDWSPHEDRRDDDVDNAGAPQQQETRVYTAESQNQNQNQKVEPPVQERNSAKTQDAADQQERDSNAISYHRPKGGEKVFSKPFMNYFSVGFDADIASDFSKFREKHPKACSSRTLNKMWYFFFGCKAMFASSRFPKHRISLRIDDVEKKVTSKAEAIVVSNMLTYAGGAVLWQDSKKEFPPPAVDDNRAETCILDGVMHMVGVGAHTRSARRVGQGSKIRIRIPADYLMQYDGEPIPALGSKEQDCIVYITHVGQSLGMELANGKQVTNDAEDDEAEGGSGEEAQGAQQQPTLNTPNPMSYHAEEIVPPK